jgi:hypothetical protein
MSYGLTGKSAPKAIYTYLKIIIIIIKINIMAPQILNTPAGHPCPGEHTTPTHWVVTHPGYGTSMQPETLEPTQQGAWHPISEESWPNIIYHVKFRCDLYITIVHSFIHGAEPSLRSCQLCSWSRTSQHFTEPEGSLPC